MIDFVWYIIDMNYIFLKMNKVWGYIFINVNLNDVFLKLVMWNKLIMGKLCWCFCC